MTEAENEDRIVEFPPAALQNTTYHHQRWLVMTESASERLPTSHSTYLQQQQQQKCTRISKIHRSESIKKSGRLPQAHCSSTWLHQSVWSGVLCCKNNTQEFDPLTTFPSISSRHSIICFLQPPFPPLNTTQQNFLHEQRQDERPH